MSEKRYFEIPEEVIGMNLITKKPLQKVADNWKPDPKKPDAEPKMEDDQPWTLARWLIAWVLCREEWTKGLKSQLLARKIVHAVDEQEPGTLVSIPQEAWRKLKETFDNEDFEVAHPLGLQLCHFGDIIIDASEKSPEEPVAE